LVGCFQKAAPGIPSERCNELFDQDDGVLDDALTTSFNGATFKIPGCCTPEGACGLALDNLVVAESLKFPLSLGCVPLHRINGLLGARLEVAPRAFYAYDFGASSEGASSSVCDPKTGAAPGLTRIPGVPSFVCGCGQNAMQQPGEMLCLNDTPKETCGADPPSKDDLVLVPEFLCGCGEHTLDPGGSCLGLTPTNVCGALKIKTDKDLEAVSVEIPNSICGCIGHPQKDALCMKRVPYSVCGAKPVCSPIGNVPPATAEGCEDGTNGAVQVCKDTNRDGKGDRCVTPG
jgi:hypothetical protein